MSGGLPGKWPAGKIGKDLECGVVNLVNGPKIFFTQKTGLPLRNIAHRFYGRYAALPLLSPIQFLNIGLYSIQSVTISDPLRGIPDGLEAVVGISFVGIKRIMPYRSCYVTYIQILVLFHDSPVLQEWRLRSPPLIPPA